MQRIENKELTGFGGNRLTLQCDRFWDAAWRFRSPTAQSLEHAKGQGGRPDSRARVLKAPPKRESNERGSSAVPTCSSKPLRQCFSMFGSGPWAEVWPK